MLFMCVDRRRLPFKQVFKQPWPGVMRNVYGNQKRFETTYFQKFPGYYVTGDGERSGYDETLSGIHENKSSPSCSLSYVLNHPVMITTCLDSYLSEHHSVHY